MTFKEILSGQPLGPWMSEPESQNNQQGLP